MDAHTAGITHSEHNDVADTATPQNGQGVTKGIKVLCAVAIFVFVGCAGRLVVCSQGRSRSILSTHTASRFLKTTSQKLVHHQTASQKKFLNSSTSTKNTSPKNGSLENLTYPELIKMRMQRIVKKRLPPPQWPELDHGTAQAMANGMIIGKTNYFPMSTIVTAYYEFPSKHPPSHYEKAMGRLLAATDPMVVFLEPGSRWVDWFIARRQHALTLIVQRRFEDLVMSTTFTEEFWQNQLALDPDKQLHNGTGVMKVWNEKMVFLKAVAQLNPFNSYSFTWMDAAYFYKHPPDPENIHPLIQVNVTEAGVHRDAMLLHQVCELEPRNSWEVCGAGENFATAGNAFIGTASAVRHLYEKYFETFWAMSQRRLLVGDDQHVMTKTCCNYPEYCHVYYMGLLQRWFVLGHSLYMPVNYFNPSTRFTESCEKFRIKPVLPLPKGVVYH